MPSSLVGPVIFPFGANYKPFSGEHNHPIKNENVFEVTNIYTYRNKRVNSTNSERDEFVLENTLDFADKFHNVIADISHRNADNNHLSASYGQNSFIRKTAEALPVKKSVLHKVAGPPYNQPVNLPNLTRKEKVKNRLKHKHHRKKNHRERLHKRKESKFKQWKNLT